MFTTRLLTVLASIAILGAMPANAQDYPNKPIKLVVPFAPGAGNDVLARLTVPDWQQRLGQPIVVENRPGAGSQTGTESVARSPADGYTLVWAASDGISILPAVKASVPYKIPEDFSFVAGVTTFPYIITVNPNLPIKSMADLVAYGKANPGKLRYGTSGVGSGTHMVMEMIAKATGIQMVHVPFQGAAPAATAAIGGFIDIALAAPSTMKGYFDSGQLRVIVTTGKDAHPLYPGIPTMAQAGFPNLTAILIFGVMAPAGVPEPILARLRKELADVLKDPVWAEKLRKIGYEPEYYDGEAFKEFMVKDLARWREVAKASNIEVKD